MYGLLICMCVLSFITFIILCLLIKNYKSKKINYLEKRAKKVVNIISFISTAFAILALFISVFGLIIQTKSPKLQMEIYTMHEIAWEEENKGEELCLSYDNDEHVDFDFGVPHTWHLHIKNVGNQYAENVKIQIRFDDFAFVSQPNSFTLSDHNHGLGSYCALEHTFSELIQPGETVEVPYIPLNNAELYNEELSDDYKLNRENTNMNVRIYENNSLVLEENVFIKIVDNPMLEDDCSLEIYEDDEDKLVRKFNEHYFNHEGYFSECNLDLDSMELYPKELVFSLKKHERVYKHYLKLINVYNPVLSEVCGKLAVFYGRLYYIGLSKEISGVDIEQAIENDMAIQWRSKD